MIDRSSLLGSPPFSTPLSYALGTYWLLLKASRKLPCFRSLSVLSLAGSIYPLRPAKLLLTILAQTDRPSTLCLFWTYTHLGEPQRVVAVVRYPSPLLFFKLDIELGSQRRTRISNVIGSLGRLLDTSSSALPVGKCNAWLLSRLS